MITATVLGEVRDVARFADEDHFASYNGTAPTAWGSAGDATPCVNRGGNRTLNHALHMAAVTQLRNPGPGRDYYLRKIGDGKKPKAAVRCLIGGVSGCGRLGAWPWLLGRTRGWPRCRAVPSASLSVATLGAPRPSDRH